MQYHVHVPPPIHVNNSLQSMFLSIQSCVYYILDAKCAIKYYCQGLHIKTKNCAYISSSILFFPVCQRRLHQINRVWDKSRTILDALQPELQGTCVFILLLGQEMTWKHEGWMERHPWATQNHGYVMEAWRPVAHQSPILIRSFTPCLFGTCIQCVYMYCIWSQICIICVCVFGAHEASYCCWSLCTMCVRSKLCVSVLCSISSFWIPSVNSS